MKNRKARHARLDADGTAKPLTEIVASFIPGKLNLPGNAESYEIHDINPNAIIECCREAEAICEKASERLIKIQKSKKAEKK